MNNPFRIIAIIFLLVQLGGCSYYIVSFKNVSNEAPYSKVVNLTFETKSELIIYGFNKDSTPGKEIHEYAVTPPPGVKNRYVLSRSKIPPGSLITTISVKRCTDCFLDFKPRIKIEVSSDQLKQEYTLPIYIDGPLLVNNWGQNGKNFQFNAEYLMLVE